MAHVNVHLGVGMALGMGLAAIPVARAWVTGRQLARPIGLMIAATCILGMWAIVPNIASRVGVPLGHAWWTDAFLLHATIDRRVRGGLFIGEAAIAATLIVQYLVVLLALARARKRP